jgi:hypothetical protein
MYIPYERGAYNLKSFQIDFGFRQLVGKRTQFP